MVHFIRFRFIGKPLFWKKEFAMSRRKITCINKTNRPNPWERIRRIGGDWGRREQQDAIRDIKTGLHTYYVVRHGREVAVVIGKSRFGNGYLKTETDGENSNNLLALPECR